MKQSQPACLGFLLALAVSVGSWGFCHAQTAASSQAGELCVMTYNLRYASSTGPNSWPMRRPIMTEVIRQIAPDLFGTQEGVYPQLKDLAADLKEYDWIGLGRDGGSKGEFMAVFYRKTRLEPLAFDHYWLSDTPEVMASTTWGNSNRRMVTWVRFLDRQNGQEFFFINTHFDHQIQPAREKSAALVRERIEKLNTTLPVLLVGDFNATAETNQAYHVLTQGDFLKDGWLAAKQREGEGISTFNGFKGIDNQGIRIDWLLGRGNIQWNRAKLITFSKDGQFPSDHFPVVAWLRFGNGQ